MPMQKLFIAIVDRGRADQILHELRAFSPSGALVLYGEGTTPNRVLEILGLDRTQKELILMTIPEDLEQSLHEVMLQNFKFHKKNRGIAFSLPLNQFQAAIYNPENLRAELQDYPFHLIVTILDRGASHDCVAIARENGAPGSTVIHGRGAGVPHNTAFDLLIEPQKDIVLSLTPSPLVKQVSSALISELDLNNPASGLLFALPVSLATGLYSSTEGGRNERT